MAIGGIIKEVLSFFKDWTTYPLERLREKKDHDKNIYAEIVDIISPEFINDFFEILGYNRYEKEHMYALMRYVEYSKRADKYFFNKKIQASKNEFDKALTELIHFLVHHFFVPKNPNLTYFELYPDLLDNKSGEEIPKYEKLYKQREEELSDLQDNTKDKYNNFIRTAKNKLLV